MNTAARDQLIRARTALYLDHPMYGVLALRLVMVENTAIPTAAVSHTHVYYNPDFVLSLSHELTMSLMAHEVQHCMLDHIDRRGDRDPRRWNAAGDYVINAGLKEDGFKLGSGWLYNPDFAGMTTDHIYTLLEPPDGDGNGPAPDGGWGALDDTMPGDPAEAEVRAVEWQIATIQAANIAKAAGKLPSSMKRLIDAAEGNKVDWREKLRRFRTAHTKNDFSWTRPQRRMVPHGYYLPSLHSESLELVVNAIDTSGSIDQYTLDAFGSEVLAIQNVARPQRMINVYCDAAINHVDDFTEHDLITFQLHGGGGTDFRPPFKHVEDEGLKPTCLVYLTDGYGPFPTSPPPYPVMWVMTSDVVPPWGEYVRIDV